MNTMEELLLQIDGSMEPDRSFGQVIPATNLRQLLDYSVDYSGWVRFANGEASALILGEEKVLIFVDGEMLVHGLTQKELDKFGINLS